MKHSRALAAYPSHDAITHQRFLYISSRGARVDRATYLHSHRFDPEVIVYWDVRDESIAIHGDFALVRATNKHTIRTGGDEVTGMTAYTDAYVREGARWLCVQAQLTSVSPEHWPGDETIVSRYVNGQLQARG